MQPCSLSMSAGKRLFGDIRKILLQPAEACSTDTAVILQSPRREPASVMVLFSRQKSHHWRSFPGSNDNKLLFGQRAQWFFLRQLLKLVTFYKEVGQQHTTIFQSFLKSFHSLTRNETSKSYSEYHSRVWCKRYVAALPLARISETGSWLTEETHRARLKIHRTEMYLNMAIQDVSKHHHHPPDAAWNTIQGDALKIICN